MEADRSDQAEEHLHGSEELSMKSIDLAALELQAKRMRRIQAGCELLRDLLAAVLIGALLCAPILWQMAVDAGWWRD